MALLPPACRCWKQPLGLRSSMLLARTFRAGWDGMGWGDKQAEIWLELFHQVTVWPYIFLHAGTFEDFLIAHTSGPSQAFESYHSHFPKIIAGLLLFKAVHLPHSKFLLALIRISVCRLDGQDSQVSTEAAFFMVNIQNYVWSTSPMLL